MAQPREVHFPLFDALRGIAAIAVFSYHGLYQPMTYANVADWSWRYMRAMDIGVPIFFAISGFLLYRPFVSSRVRGRPLPSLRQYARRRALRILPAYWVCLTVVALWFSLPELNSVEGIARHYFFLQIYDPDFAVKGIGQAWTLCNEVIFYLTLPLWAIWAHRRKAGLRTELVALGVIVLLTYAWRIFMLGHADPASPRSLTWTLTFPAWTDHLAIGMAVAAISVHRAEKPWMRRPALALSLALGLFVASAWVLQPGIREGMDDTGFFARQVLYGACVFFLLLPAVFGDQREGRSRRALAFPPLVFLGTMSYSFYLLHLAVIGQIAESFWDGAPSGVMWAVWFAEILAVSSLLGAIGYFVLERPFMRMARMRRTASAHAAP